MLGLRNFSKCITISKLPINVTAETTSAIIDKIETSPITQSINFFAKIQQIIDKNKKKNIMNATQQLEMIEQHLDISLKKLANKIGATPQNFYDIRNGKIKSISATLATKIAECYPQFSMDWLLFGRGEMINSDNQSSNFSGNNNVGSGNVLKGNAQMKVCEAEKFLKIAETAQAQTSEVIATNSKLVSIIEKLSTKK